MSEANAVLVAWKSWPLEVTTYDDMWRRYVPGTRADLTILTDHGQSVVWPDVPMSELSGLAVGARVRVDLNLHPVDAASPLT